MLTRSFFPYALRYMSGTPSSKLFCSRFPNIWLGQYYRAHKVHSPANRERNILKLILTSGVASVALLCAWNYRTNITSFSKSLCEASSEDSDVTTKKRKGPGFRNRKIINYEDRIRAYSTPDKIFRYFATIKYVYEDGDTEIFMTPEDFVRSISRGVMQPEGLGLDSFKRIDSKTPKLQLNLEDDSVFYSFGSMALVSFSDYIFLLTVLSTPPRQFEIAFRMFDLDGDGNLDLEEFKTVQSVIRDTTAIGKRHRNHATTGSVVKGMNSALCAHFFGPDGKEKLTINQFLEFQANLYNELMKIEFERYDPVNGKIMELDFAKCLLAYAQLSDAKRRKMLRRIKRMFGGEKSKGISFEEFSAFAHLLRSIGDVDKALTFHHLAGADIDQDTMRRVGLSVAHVELSPHLIEVVFTLFDENGDGKLSNTEFVETMKHRVTRGLDKSMDTGFTKFFGALYKCAKKQLTFVRHE